LVAFHTINETRLLGRRSEDDPITMFVMTGSQVRILFAAPGLPKNHLSATRSPWASLVRPGGAKAVEFRRRRDLDQSPERLDRGLDPNFTPFSVAFQVAPNPFARPVD